MPPVAVGTSHVATEPAFGGTPSRWGLVSDMGHPVRDEVQHVDGPIERITARALSAAGAREERRLYDAHICPWLSVIGVMFSDTTQVDLTQRAPARRTG